MCRMVAYFGPPIRAADVVTRPSRSIIRQSYDARERLCAAGEYVPASLNGDGYGIGWYSADGVPCVYKSIRPAWNDANLHHLAEKGIRSHLLFAHVRAATAGTSVTEESCHPFAYGRYLFQHNGAIAGWRNGRIRRALLDQLSDELYEYAVRNGASDSIVAFALFLNQMKRGTDVQYSAAALQCMLLRTIALILETTKACLAMVESEASSAAASGSSSTPQDDVFLLNFVVTDGETLLATKYAHGLRNPEAPAASLYFGAASAYEPVASDSSTTAGDYAFAYTAATRSGVVIVASEPLTSNPCDWVSLPRNSILVVTANQHLLMERLPENFSRLSRAVADWNDNHDWTDENSSIMMALRTLSSQDQSDFLMEAKQKSGSALFESSETIIRSRRLENSSRMVGHGLGNSLTESNQCNELIRLGEPDEIIHTGQSQVICMTDLQTGTETGLSMPERGDASERNQHRSMSAASGAAARGKTLLICGNGDGSMSAWDRISGSLWISCPISVEGRGILGLIQWKPNDRSSLRNSDGECDLGILTVSSAADNSLRLHQWTEIGPKLIAEFFCGTETGHPLCLAADQGFIYIGFQDCSVRRLDISKLASERIMLTSAAAIQDFQKYELLRSELLIRMGNQSRDEDQRSDGELDREIKIARQHSGPIHCLAVHSRTHSLFSGSGDGTIGVWNTRDNTRETVLRGHRGAVLALQIDEKADLLFSGSRDRHIRVWDISLNTNYVCRRALMSWEYHRNDICALELSELFFFSGSIDGVIIVWNRTDLVPLAELRFADEAPLSLLRVGRISSASSRTDSRRTR
ncbi:hypothetical protein F1559_003541 [Cyanidiococcus yangmingshanensis]|uniref:Glutamine amidotransferase type-2 domain-containing protein n=1 Tax=Cyanidiococcus yangmingshanensis TaxID=2690220 RepID=A0A7J7IRT1_9RHOD|nr:hypothetical protein F1559_003541 [Cyanidiococcus yangmingshanensis]